MVQAVFLLGIIVAPTLGPTLGGWITDNYTWNWCFFINVPIAHRLDVPGDAPSCKDPPGQQAHGPAGWTGSGSASSPSAWAALQYVLEEGNADDWFNDTLDPPPRDRRGRLPGEHGVVGAVVAGTAIRS